VVLPWLPVTPIKASFWLDFCQNAAASRSGQGPVAFQHQHGSPGWGALRRRRFHPDHRGHGTGLKGPLGQKLAAIDLAAGQADNKVPGLIRAIGADCR